MLGLVSRTVRKIASKKLLGDVMLEERTGQPDGIGEAVLLIVSHQARWTTGQYVAASGGSTS